MYLTPAVGQRILAVDLICIYYIFEWKLTVLGICLSVQCTVDNISITSGSMWKIYTLHTVCLVLWCSDRSWKMPCVNSLEAVLHLYVPACH